MHHQRDDKLMLVKRLSQLVHPNEHEERCVLESKLWWAFWKGDLVVSTRGAGGEPSRIRRRDYIDRLSLGAAAWISEGFAASVDGNAQEGASRHHVRPATDREETCDDEIARQLKQAQDVALYEIDGVLDDPETGQGTVWYGECTAPWFLDLAIVKEDFARFCALCGWPLPEFWFSQAERERCAGDEAVKIAKAERWFHAEIASGRRCIKNNILNHLQKEFRISNGAARDRIWRDHAPADWKKPGRMKDSERS